MREMQGGLCCTLLCCSCGAVGRGALGLISRAEGSIPSPAPRDATVAAGRGALGVRRPQRLNRWRCSPRIPFDGMNPDRDPDIHRWQPWSELSPGCGWSGVAGCVIYH